MFARMMSFLLMLGAAILFFAFLGVAVYVGVIVFLFLFLMVLLTSSAEKSGVWWRQNSADIKSWWRRGVYRFKNFFDMEEQPVHEVNMDKVEIINQKSRGQTVWKCEKGIPLTIKYKQGAEVKMEKVWLLEVIRLLSGKLQLVAICVEDKYKCFLNPEDVVIVYGSDGKVFDADEFLLSLGIF